jgi:hypothetical protein
MSTAPKTKSDRLSATPKPVANLNALLKQIAVPEGTGDIHETVPPTGTHEGPSNPTPATGDIHE